MTERGEDEIRERFRELLEELRTILPGVQVLFAFLLTVPFSSRFPELDGVERAGFAITLFSAAASSVLLIAPTVYHRIDRRQQRRERLRAAIVYQVLGVSAGGLAIVAGVFVVGRFVFGTPVGMIAAGFSAALIVLSWYLVPLARRR